MKRLNVIILFSLAILVIKCSKDTKQVKNISGELREFVHSPVYKDFTGRNRLAGKVDIDAARIVPVDNVGAMVHIPVIEQKNVAATIIGLPSGKGQYELLYQDNRAALSGTGNIFLYTSSNELFGRIDLKNGKIKSMETENMPAASMRNNGAMRVDCGFLCRLNKCYTAVKAQFPGEVVCDLLDIFMGVCTSATVTTCLIKMLVK
jgi:hypothetical protein